MRRVNPFILSSVSLAALIATPAFAQDTQQDTPPPEALTSEQEAESGQDAQTDTNVATAAADDGAAITVTGSRIRRPNLESPLPVTSVGGQEFFETGDVSIGDKLAELPSIRSTFTQANSTRGLGTSGLNLLDLRGLGIQRTLVLVNGRRHVGGDVLLTGVSVDINTLPADLIDRVDVVTGGNSAVYGSDAIAGVVNFVLKQDYEGFQVRGQGGLSKYGDAGAYFASALWGTNFADGRGNVAVNVEYARRDQAWGDERDWFKTVLTVVDTDPAGSDGNPDRVLNPDFRSASFSQTGTIRFNTNDCGTGGNGTNFACAYLFQPNGDLVAQTGQRVGIGPGGQFIGGNGTGFYEGHLIQITPQLDRWNINLVGHVELSPAFVPFVEAKYSRTDSVGTGASGPAFVAASFALGDFMSFFGAPFRNRERIFLDNPYLNDQARAKLCELRLAQGPQTTCPGGANFQVQQNIPLPSRLEEGTRDTFRIVGGLRGDIGGSWNYEVAANYGQLKEKTKVNGNLNTQRALLALDAVRDPNTGEIVCRSQIDPNAAYGGSTYFYSYYYGPDDPRFDPNFEATLQADIDACVPAAFFGGNPLTQAQKDYLLLDTTSTGETSQLDLTAFISGDTSGFFELPGGPVGLVAGVQYREDNLAYDQDRTVQLGYTFYNALPTFKAPKSKVKEAFGEIRLPIVKDVPFLQELEVSAAARVSDYNIGNTGTVWAWNVNGLWSPVEGVRLRGNVARAVRAPNQVELFTPFGQNFSLINDPCSVDNIGAGTPNRPINCAAAGVPAGLQIQYASSLPFRSGGNSGLEAEKSKSITLGGVITPTFLPGFSVSADYFNIKVENAIAATSAQFIIDSCYDLATLNNQYCALFQRAGAGQTGHDGLPFAIIDQSLQQFPFNFAALKTRGIDVEAAYRARIGNLGRIDTRFTYTHLFQNDVFVDPNNPDDADRSMSEIGDPQDAFNWNTNFSTGRFTFGYQMRYISKMTVTDYESLFEYDGDGPNDEDFADRKWFPRRFYHDVRFAVDVGPKYNFYMGIDNLSNAKPPYASTGIGNETGTAGGSAIWDVIGRFFYAGVKANF
jgi:outer membrane receptor protein involved in Fe transport